MGERELIRLFSDKLLYNNSDINWTTQSQLMSAPTPYFFFLPKLLN